MLDAVAAEQRELTAASMTVRSDDIARLSPTNVGRCCSVARCWFARSAHRRLEFPRRSSLNVSGNQGLSASKMLVLSVPTKAAPNLGDGARRTPH